MINKMINKLKLLYFNVLRGFQIFVSYRSGYKIIPKPAVMYLEVTYRCTCKCAFCERWKVGPGLAEKELRTDEIKRLLSEAYQIGVRYLGLTGGEAFLRSDIFEIADFARGLGMNVTVASNGTLIDENNIERIVKTFNSIAISVDGTSAETHDSLRGVKGVYDHALKVIDPLKDRLPLTVNMVMTDQNYTQIDEYIRFFSEKGVHVQLTPVHDYAESYLKVKDEVKNVNLQKFNEEWLRLSKKYPFLKIGFYRRVPNFFADPNSLHSAYTCFAGAVAFFANPYGDIFPCEFFRQKMGNIREKPLKQIWEEAVGLRRLIASAKRPCTCWTHCIVPLNIKLTKYIALKKSI